MTDSRIDAIVSGGFFLIAGPCVIESEELCFRVADHLKKVTERLGIPLIFKSSYVKANRLSAGSFTGPGIDAGLRILQKVRAEFDIPVLTDIHERTEVSAASEVAGILQIPAMLSRQTELLLAAVATGKWVNIKKGQFLAPEDMARIVTKADSKKLMLTERGTTFGYRHLVVDFRSLLIMKETTGLPVIFDATHALQLPGAGDGVSGGQPQYVIPYSRAAMAIGIDGLFVETHPDPGRALSDAAAMLPLDRMEELLEEVTRIRYARGS